MKSKMRSTYFIGAAALAMVLAVVLFVLMFWMIKIDKDDDIPVDPSYQSGEAVSDTDVSGSDASSSDAVTTTAATTTTTTTAAPTQPQKKALDVNSFVTAFSLTRASMTEKYGTGYTEYAAGSDGSYNAYKYADLGVAFVFPASDTAEAPDTVSWIECDDTVTVLGAHEGMNVPEATAAWGWEGSWKMQQQGGESAKYRMYMEKQVENIFVRVYTNWLEGDEQTSQLSITINKS